MSSEQMIIPVECTNKTDLFIYSCIPCVSPQILKLIKNSKETLGMIEVVSEASWLPARARISRARRAL